MPRAEIRVPTGELTDAQKSQLTKELTDTLLEVEGAPDTPEARSIAWVFIDEYESEEWTIGGNETTDLAFEATITVPEGSLSDDDKERMVEAVTSVLSDVGEEDFNPLKTWVILNEVPNGNWGAGIGGGTIFRLSDIVNFVGAE